MINPTAFSRFDGVAVVVVAAAAAAEVLQCRFNQNDINSNTPRYDILSDLKSTARPPPVPLNLSTQIAKINIFYKIRLEGQILVKN